MSNTNQPNMALRGAITIVTLVVAMVTVMYLVASHQAATPQPDRPMVTTHLGSSTMTEQHYSDGSWRVTVDGRTCTTHPDGHQDCS
jgi:hypothetical protein